MGSEQLIGRDKNRMRNLKQYKDLSDEEFDKVFGDLIDADTAEQVLLLRTDEEIEELVDEKLGEFGEDYDLSDMKINDRLVLRNLIRSIISLEDFEDISINLRSNTLNRDNVIVFDRLSNIMSRLRSDISDMQNDLGLTRKMRKDSREEDFISYLENLKAKARKFYKQKSLHIFCPECKFLLATVWLLYPDAENEIDLWCKHCGHFLYNLRLNELYKTDNQNIDDVEMP
jgi:hypothetical protein